jgi:hypothetical protein
MSRLFLSRNSAWKRLTRQELQVTLSLGSDADVPLAVNVPASAGHVGAAAGGPPPSSAPGAAGGTAGAPTEAQIDQFTTVTGGTRAQAVEHLRNANGNLDSAIVQYFAQN